MMGECSYTKGSQFCYPHRVAPWSMSGSFWSQVSGLAMCSYHALCAAGWPLSGGRCRMGGGVR